jgi:hypothetical protein
MLLIYQNACRTLKEEDKLLISFLMCSKVLQIKNLITLVNIPFYKINKNFEFIYFNLKKIIKIFKINKKKIFFFKIVKFFQTI